MTDITGAGGTKSPESPDSADLGKGTSEVPALDSYDSLKTTIIKAEADLKDAQHAYVALKHDYDIAKQELATIKSSEMYTKMMEMVSHVTALIKSHNKLSPASAVAQVDATIIDQLAKLVK